MMLEDMGMSNGYPRIHISEENADGIFRRTIYASLQSGRRVSIESNQRAKFALMFSLFDFFIDSNNPSLEGYSFSKKYKKLRFDNDYDLVLRELFRIAKVMRNSLIHNPSSINELEGGIKVAYKFNETNYCLEISSCGLSKFYTLLIMYIRGNLGSGAYFMGITRSLYEVIVNEINVFSDEFLGNLNEPLAGLKINPSNRLVIINAPYIVEKECIKIEFDRINAAAEWEGVDYNIKYKEGNFLIPEESLNNELTINEDVLFNNWEHGSKFPLNI